MASAYMCDRCGKPYVEQYSLRFAINQSVEEDKVLVTLDICPECYKRFKIWLDEGGNDEQIVDDELPEEIDYGYNIPRRKED